MTLATRLGEALRAPAGSALTSRRSQTYSHRTKRMNSGPLFLKNVVYSFLSSSFKVLSSYCKLVNPFLINARHCSNAARYRASATTLRISADCRRRSFRLRAIEIAVVLVGSGSCSQHPKQSRKFNLINKKLPLPELCIIAIKPAITSYLLSEGRSVRPYHISHCREC